MSEAPRPGEIEAASIILGVVGALEILLSAGRALNIIGPGQPGTAFLASSFIAGVVLLAAAYLLWDSRRIGGYLAVGASAILYFVVGFKPGGVSDIEYLVGSLSAIALATLVIVLVVRRWSDLK